MSNSHIRKLFLAPLAAAALLVGLGDRSARADEIPEWFETLAKAEKDVNGRPVLFLADIRFCSEGPAEGKIYLIFPDDYVELDAVHATMLKDRIVFILIDAAGEFLTAQVIDDEDSPDSDIWNLVGSSIENTTFDAVTFTTRVSGSNCEPADFGQAPVDFDVCVKPQSVHSQYLPNLAAVRAKISVSFNNTASGVFELRFRDGSKHVYDVVFGAIYPLNDRILVQLAGVQRGTGYLMQATAMTQSTTNPDCLIWDLANGSSGEEVTTFEAETAIQFSR